jgi:hypothetical protein
MLVLRYPDGQNVSGGTADATAHAAFLKLRVALLDLHKTLLDSERVGYEQAFGTIQSPGNFLQLAIKDPWFAWLQPLAALITSMDERLEDESPITRKDVEDFSKRSRRLLAPEEAGEGFGKHYYEALQRDPDVVLAHGKIVKLK